MFKMVTNKPLKENIMADDSLLLVKLQFFIVSKAIQSSNSLIKGEQNRFHL